LTYDLRYSSGTSAKLDAVEQEFPRRRGREERVRRSKDIVELSVDDVHQERRFRFDRLQNRLWGVRILMGSMTSALMGADYCKLSVD
jgi:hypothetical protein